MSIYHNILGIQPGASKQEIKVAYRRLAKMYHPDRNKSASAKQMFIRIDQAYNALMSGKAAPSTINSGTYRPNRRQKTPYEKWAHVHDAPTNPEDYAEWVRVKREQMARDGVPKSHREKMRDLFEDEFDANALQIQIFVAIFIMGLILAGITGSLVLTYNTFTSSSFGDALVYLPFDLLVIYLTYKLTRFLIKDVLIKTR